jgi:phosphorylase/glycogen(starch) synthase
VCNKVGGIHTVIASKAPTVKHELGDKYITIGPDFSSDYVSPEFEEDTTLMAAWRESLYNRGVRVRIGRWAIEGRPIAILVDFKSFIREKDNILKQLWEAYRVDSLSGQWDYVEPVLFGHAAGVVIASFAETMCQTTDKIVAHFHEWMAAAGSLYLHDNAPYVATVFSTHATVMGRCIAGNRLPLYNDLHKFNADELARQFNVMAKHSLEKSAATFADAFLTVSDITANECRYLLGREVTRITPNGFENGFVPAEAKLAEVRATSRRKFIEVASATWGYDFAEDTLIVASSGRY